MLRGCDVWTGRLEIAEGPDLVTTWGAAVGVSISST